MEIGVPGIAFFHDRARMRAYNSVTFHPRGGDLWDSSFVKPSELGRCA